MIEPVSYQSLLDDVQRSLRPERFLHVLGVTHTAVQLAGRHGERPGLAAAAGLIHDRSKGLSSAEIEEDLKARGLEIPEEDRPYPAIWHGLHAAAWVREDASWVSGGEREELAEAIRYHSTAEAGLGRLGKLLFVADFLEPGRSFEGIEALRRIARDDLEEGYKSCLAAKCRYMVKKQGKFLHPGAVRALHESGLSLEGEAGAARAS